MNIELLECLVEIRVSPPFMFFLELIYFLFPQTSGNRGKQAQEDRTKEPFILTRITAVVVRICLEVARKDTERICMKKFNSLGKHEREKYVYIFFILADFLQRLISVL